MTTISLSDKIGVVLFLIQPEEQRTCISCASDDWCILPFSWSLREWCEM